MPLWGESVAAHVSRLRLLGSELLDALELVRGCRSTGWAGPGPVAGRGRD